MTEAAGHCLTGGAVSSFFLNFLLQQGRSQSLALHLNILLKGIHK